MLHYLGLLLLVADISARTYEGRNYQYTAISNKLDQYISNLDTVGNELKELNAAYKNLKQQGDDYVSGNSFDEGRLLPLLGAGSKEGETWDENIDRCNWAEFDISRGYYQGQVSLTKKVYCEAANHFLTAIEYSDQRGILVGKCCEKKIKKKKNKG